MKKTDVILLSEIDDYLKYVEARRDLLNRLHIYKEDQERQLKRLKTIEAVTKTVKLLKDKLGKVEKDEEIKAAIKKYARYH